MPLSRMNPSSLKAMPIERIHSLESDEICSIVNFPPCRGFLPWLANTDTLNTVHTKPLSAWSYLSLLLRASRLLSNPYLFPQNSK